jgi:hypothetical protein
LPRSSIVFVASSLFHDAELFAAAGRMGDWTLYFFAGARYNSATVRLLKRPRRNHAQTSENCDAAIAH